ncbi:MAG: F0F1 ATP synthase subunit gamma, partial [Acidimicrobiales bacterium]|nr:F0F1 ATP synthase subunit gamma [Acidimicrobiales bacterium]
MAGGQERVLRRRIRSVESTKKITRAMELIATTRVAKAQEQAAAAKPYAQEITNVVLDLVRAGAAKDHPLLRENADASTALLLVITSDRGLCGAYNSTVIRMAERAVKARQAEGATCSLVIVGTKAYRYFRGRGYPIAAHFAGVTDRPTYEHARAVAGAIRPAYEAGEVASVDLFYWQFFSAGVQRFTSQR